MAAPKFIWIDGKRYAWRDILEMRRQQRERQKTRQLTLFDLKEDARPAPERTAAGRYEEPSLFTLLDDNANSHYHS